MLLLRLRVCFKDIYQAAFLQESLVSDKKEKFTPTPDKMSILLNKWREEKVNPPVNSWEVVVAEEDRQLALFQRCGELSQAVVGQLGCNVLKFWIKCKRVLIRQTKTLSIGVESNVAKLPDHLRPGVFQPLFGDQGSRHGMRIVARPVAVVNFYLKSIGSAPF